MTEKIAIVGVGAMGGAIAKGLYNTKQYQLLGLNPVNPRVTQLAEDLEMTVVNDPAALVNLAPDLVILTTPAPLTVATARSLANLPTTTPVVSAAAGITQEQLQAVLGDRPLATMIPNTPVAVNAGAIGLALPQEMVEPAGTLIKEVLGSLGTALLRDQVASPGGTTIRGIDALEQHGFRAGLIEAVDQASGGHYVD